MNVFTIGFTQSTAEHFFTRLQKAKVKRVMDVRLHNVSQLAGFAKKDDLHYFLRVIGGIDYVHVPELAPTQTLLDAVKKKRGDWGRFEWQFLQLMADRRIEKLRKRKNLDHACLLCSEDKPPRCHRRLILEYLQKHWGDLDVVHL